MKLFNKINQLIFINVLFLCLIISISSLANKQNEILNIRAGSNGDVYRLVLETSIRVDAKLILKKTPYRAIITLPESLWRVGISPRQGTFKPLVPLDYTFRNTALGKSNLSIQTKEPFSIDKIFWLPPSTGGERLVIDFVLSSDTEFNINQRALNELTINSFKNLLNSPPDKINADLSLFSGITKKKLKSSDMKTGNDIVSNTNQKQLKRKFVLVIDPGHGGKDPGAIGFSETLEKDVNLRAAKILKAKFDEDKEIKAYLTRNEDEFISLSDRFKIAQNYKADLFISIHSDSTTSSKPNGYSIFSLHEKFAPKRENANLAKDENNKEILAGNIILENQNLLTQKYLYDLVQKQSLDESIIVKNLILKELKGISTKSRGGKKENFGVLKAPDIPSILIEMGFLSNKKDEANLNNKKFLTEFCRRLYVAILNYKNFER